MDEEITFRPLGEADIPLMHRWLNTPHVVKWYYVRGVERPSLEWVRERYLPRIQGEDPTRAFVTVLDGRPIGYIQAYFIDNHPEYAAAVRVPPGTVGIDMFIGEEDAVHRGLGTRIVGRFLESRAATRNVSTSWSGTGGGRDAPLGTPSQTHLLRRPTSVV